MYAIVEIAGFQYKVEEGKSIYVNRLEGNEGENVEFDKILLKDKEGKVEVGTPTVKGKVTAKIESHLKDDKVVVFKKKRRKGYRVKNGHRQQLTKLSIEKIS